CTPQMIDNAITPTIVMSMLMYLSIRFDRRSSNAVDCENRLIILEAMNRKPNAIANTIRDAIICFVYSSVNMANYLSIDTLYLPEDRLHLRMSLRCVQQQSVRSIPELRNFRLYQTADNDRHSIRFLAAIVH